MTMSLDEAVTTVQRFAKQYEAVLTLAAEIDKVKKIDQLSMEANDRRSAKMEEIAAAERRLNELKSKIDTAESELADVNIRAAQAKEASKSFSEDIVANARNEASRIVYAANEDAARIVSEVNARLAEVNAAQDAISRAETILDADLAKKRKELAELEGKIASARKLIARFIS